eukprot:2848255-Pyramimonas_sp.AAC.1
MTQGGDQDGSARTAPCVTHLTLGEAKVLTLEDHARASGAVDNRKEISSVHSSTSSAQTFCAHIRAYGLHARCEKRNMNTSLEGTQTRTTCSPAL